MKFTFADKNGIDSPPTICQPIFCSELDKKPGKKALGAETGPLYCGKHEYPQH